MIAFSRPRWTRRQWLAHHTLALVAVAPSTVLAQHRRVGPRGRLVPATGPGTLRAARAAAQAERIDLTSWQALAQLAVDVAHTAGARYAEARLTRQVTHRYGFPAQFERDEELVGVGVRALVDGYWGFSASTVLEVDDVHRLAHDAVAQARTNAKGTPWTVELGPLPAATGSWTTPMRIDPFTIPIDEKLDYIQYIRHLAGQGGLALARNGGPSFLMFLREERVIATSEGALFVQTCYESGGRILVVRPPPAHDITAAIGAALGVGDQGTEVAVHEIGVAGAGWELVLDANIPEQFRSGRLREEITQKNAIPSRPFTIGKYTLVCDGATMAALVEATLGLATQLDRALGYEANAGGTSWIDDPLGMVGTAHVTSPLVTLTANRSAPKQLATVKWDDEGVEPEPFPMIKEGVLTDFQTTREQAAWLAPYYQQRHLPVRSHGCANSESAHCTPLQHMPNLVLEPSTSTVGLQDLIADVTDGIMVEAGKVLTADSQARTGLLVAGGAFGGQMRQIKNGRLGPIITGGGVFYNTRELWKNVQAIGGPTSTMITSTSKAEDFNSAVYSVRLSSGNEVGKGEPPQFTSHSVQAAAATLPNQPLIDPLRKI